MMKAITLETVQASVHIRHLINDADQTYRFKVPGKKHLVT